MTRRDRGDGTVSKDGSGWIALVELPPGPDGKRRRRKRRAPTKTAAKVALKELQEEIEGSLNPSGERRTVAEAVEQFVATRPKVNRSTKTVEMEKWRSKLIVSGLGRKRIGQLTVTDCDSFLQAAANGEYGSRKIGREALRRIRSLLVKVLRNEMRTGNLTRNVAELSELPADERPYDATDDDEDGDSGASTRDSMSYDEFQRLWRVARSPLIVIVELCGRNGLRPSEARGLRWQCVNTDEKTITVNRQLSSADRLTNPRTRRSRRTIPVDDLTIECLQAWQTKQDGQKDRAGDLWSDDLDLVFSTRYGTPINRNNLSRMITAACEEANIDRIVPYELRHTAITFQLDSGAEAWRVADWAGTSERMIEEIYRHRLTRVSDLGSVQVPVWASTRGNGA